ncbi:hypothetical protein [Acetatifactor muris]|uniref:hypothetical protein n=1 Tax=Acetatifactor muris TaxID=879566 RepID=UPI0023F2D1B8|nr:hypothetical protein [Acetatifactor muris]
MMAGYTNKLKITVWVSAVYVLSFICYVPTLLEQNGIIIPNILLYVKYLYVCIPSIAAVFLLICGQNVKVYFLQMFSGKITAVKIPVDRKPHMKKKLVLMEAAIYGKKHKM